jgi:hypothetical protein
MHALRNYNKETQHALNLGNEKPEFLNLVEKSLWRSLMDASITGDASQALKAFVAEFQDLEIMHKIPTAVDWYSPDCKPSRYISAETDYEEKTQLFQQLPDQTIAAVKPRFRGSLPMREKRIIPAMKC